MPCLRDMFLKLFEFYHHFMTLCWPSCVLSRCTHMVSARKFTAREPRLRDLKATSPGDAACTTVTLAAEVSCEEILTGKSLEQWCTWDCSLLLLVYLLLSSAPAIAHAVVGHVPAEVAEEHGALSLLSSKH